MYLGAAKGQGNAGPVYLNLKFNDMFRDNLIKKILISATCNEEGKMVLKQALFFQEIFSCTITLLYVIPQSSLLDTLFGDKQVLEVDQKREALEELNKCMAGYFNGAIPDFIKMEVVVGEMGEVILQTISEQKYDLIIMKEHKQIGNLLSKIKRISDKIISKAVCPVMIIHEKWDKTGINEILVPIDVTKKCKSAVLWASALSKKLGARIQIVSVITTNVKIEKSLTYKRAELIKAWILNQGIDCEMTIIKSEQETMHEALLNFSEEGNADLIMILTHEEYIMSNNYLARFAKEVIHRSPKPVLSVVSRETMFKVFSERYEYGKNERFEHLNIKEDDIKNF